MIRVSVLLRLCITAAFALSFFSNSVADDRSPQAERPVSQAQLMMFVPSNPIDCDSSNPWRAGRWNLADGGYVPSGGCIGLQFSLPQKAAVFLLHEDNSGNLTRFFPMGCDASESLVVAAGEHWFPQPRDGREHIIVLDQDAGVEKFHLALVPEGIPAEPLLQLIAHVPTGSSQCKTAGEAIDKTPRIADLKRRTDALNETIQLSMTWLSVLLNHY